MAMPAVYCLGSRNLGYAQFGLLVIFFTASRDLLHRVPVIFSSLFMKRECLLW
jgi:hypothetical protein